MTAMVKVNEQVLAALTVGQVAEQFNVTVRTLHHYDEIGLLVPGERTSAGYRLYSDKDIARLQHVVVYRRLGFDLETIALLLDDPTADLGEHLRRQRAAVMSRLDEMHDLVTAIDRALEREMTGIKLTKEEQKELFGDSFSDDYAAEAEQRWGGTEEYKESQRRVAQYTKEQWRQVKAEGDANHGELAAAMNEGEPANSERAMAAAEQHRLLIEKWFNPVPYPMHRGMSDMYVTDPRFTKTYGDIAPGLAQYVRDAIHANADRAARAADGHS
jgi:MerR family transcriptional regulator, thiopeptide resistance regulator